MILQKLTPARVLIVVAIIAGATIAPGLWELYWLLYAIILTGINCNDEIFNTKNVHISLVEI